MRALGSAEMPARIPLDAGEYLHRKTLKHTFFAATGIYVRGEEKAVIKLARSTSFLGLPLAWIGRWLTRREVEIYRMVDDLPGVPGFLGTHDENGFGHVYVEGHPMRRGETVPTPFFPAFETLLEAIHRRDIAYVDLSKPENVLVGDDDRPYLIDFGIAWCWNEAARRLGARRFLPNALGRLLLNKLRDADRFHMLKHWRRAAPETLSPERMRFASTRRGWIRVHGFLRKPWRRLRSRFKSAIGDDGDST